MQHLISLMTLTLLLIASALCLGACLNDVSDVREAIRRTDSDVQAHATSMSAAAATAEAHRELDRHSESMADDMDDIRWRLNHLEFRCDAEDLDRVWSVIDEIERRIDAYLDDAGDAADAGDMAAMRRISDEYGGDMSALLDNLDQRVRDADCV
jgi:hypothetical protein